MPLVQVTERPPVLSTLEPLSVSTLPKASALVETVQLAVTVAETLSVEVAVAACAADRQYEQHRAGDRPGRQSLEHDPPFVLAAALAIRLDITHRMAPWAEKPAAAPVVEAAAAARHQ